MRRIISVFLATSICGCAGVTSNWPPTDTVAEADVTSLTSLKDLIATQINTYTSTGKAASDGRMATEVPVLLAAVGGASAAAFGANSDLLVGIATLGATGSVTSAYFAPRQKAKAYLTAIDALVCLKAATDPVAALESPPDTKTEKLESLPDTQTVKQAKVRLLSALLTPAEMANYIAVSSELDTAKAGAASAVFTGLLKIRAKLAARLNDAGSVPDYQASILSAKEIFEKAEEVKDKQKEVETAAKKMESVDATDQNFQNFATPLIAGTNFSPSDILTESILDLKRTSNEDMAKFVELPAKVDACVLLAG